MPTPLTRLAVETYLVGPDLLSGQRGRMCARAKLYTPGSVAPGSIPALAGPITRGLGFLGITPDDPSNPVDDDFLLVPDASRACLLDLSDLFLAERILGNWDRPNEALSMQRQDWGDLFGSLQQEVKDLRARYRDIYGLGAASVSLGSIDLGFAATDDRCGPYGYGYGYWNG